MNIFAMRRTLFVALIVPVILVGASSLPGVRLAAQNAPHLNRMIEALEAGKPALTGDTWQWVEQEHAPLDVAGLKKTLDSILAKKNDQGQMVLAPFVRIPIGGDEPKAWLINQVLEAGAMGIIVPDVETAQQAGDVVRIMRYPQKPGSKYFEPNGRRGCCSFPATWGLKDPREYWDGGKGDLWPLNPAGDVFAAVMIESPEAVKNISAILKVPGLSTAIIGTSDLNVSMGEGWVTPLNPTFGPKTEAAIQKVFSTCAAMKKYCGIASPNMESEKKYLGMGARLIYRLGGYK